MTPDERKLRNMEMLQRRCTMFLPVALVGNRWADSVSLLCGKVPPELAVLRQQHEQRSQVLKSRR